MPACRRSPSPTRSPTFSTRSTCTTWCWSAATPAAPCASWPCPAGLTRDWIQPLLGSAAIRHDLTRFARGLQGTELTGAADWLGRFQRPVRLVWGTRDKHFTLELGRRLAAAFPLAQLDEVADATTFVSIDRPDAVSGAIEGLLATSRT